MNPDEIAQQNARPVIYSVLDGAEVIVSVARATWEEAQAAATQVANERGHPITLHATALGPHSQPQVFKVNPDS